MTGSASLLSQKWGFLCQHAHHFFKTPDFACVERTQNQGFWKNGKGIE